jgi:hypothetical protein
VPARNGKVSDLTCLVAGGVPTRTTADPAGYTSFARTYSVIACQGWARGSNPFARSKIENVRPGQIGDRTYLRHG